MDDVTAWFRLPHSDFGCPAVARGLSQKPHGRFRSFLAGELKCVSRRHMQKVIAVGSISELLEGFFITIVTLSDFPKILFREDAL